MYQFPRPEDLIRIRKTLKSVKIPEPFDGMWCSEPGIGGVKFSKSDDDFIVTWVCFEDGKLTEPKNVSFNRLNTDAAQEYDRLHAGIVIANVLHAQGNKMLQSIAGPNEAMKEANLYFKEAKKWYEWAIANPA